MFRDLGCILLVQNLLNSTLEDTLPEGAALRDFAKPFYPFPYSDTAFEEKMNPGWEGDEREAENL